MQNCALISVYDKSGITSFAEDLAKMGWKLWASGGTFNEINEALIPVSNIERLVGPPLLDHRVVTLSREIHAGLLAELNNAKHLKEMEENKLPIFHMVVCDFYPLHLATGKAIPRTDEVIKLTDIGGPAMVRSGAKGGRIVICRVQDRKLVIDLLKQYGTIGDEIMQTLRARAEYEVAKYVAESARFHSRGRLQSNFFES